MPKTTKDKKHNPYLDCLDFRYVYLLSDPRDNSPFYVGKAKCPITRLGSHLSNDKEHPALVAKFLELKKLFLLPKITILDTVHADSIDRMETLYIKHYSDLFPATMLNTSGLTKKERKRKTFYIQE